MTAMNVINTILGSSSSFSTGGPGKGMHSRTTKNSILILELINLIFNEKVLNALYYVESASAINHHFQETGLFGIKISGNA